MRAKRDWERVRSPHARFLEGLEAAVAVHPSASARVGASAERSGRPPRARLTIVGSTTDNVIPMPTDRGRKPRSRRGRFGGDGSAA
jgi:hypothetical protein